MKIVPAILVHSSEEYFQQLNVVDDLVDLIHIDVADGRFVPNKTWADPDMIRDATVPDIELHLMVEDPEKEIKRWEDVPQVKRYIIHAETKTHLTNVIGKAKSKKQIVSIALNPGTNINTIDPFVTKIDHVQCMGVKPGFQGQPFETSTLDTIKKIRQKYPKLAIAVDGHVDEETLPQLLEAGATHLCVGSAIFKAADPEAAFKRLQAMADQLTSS